MTVAEMNKHEKRNKRKYILHLRSLIADIQFESVYFDIPLNINQRITVVQLEAEIAKV
jgi:hypothetical protein